MCDGSLYRSNRAGKRIVNMLRLAPLRLELNAELGGQFMWKQFLTASVATAMLVGSVSPAMAQYKFSTDIQAPVGATATVNLKVPLGAVAASNRKATYGLTLGYGQQLDRYTDDGRLATSHVKLADLRFSDSFKLHRAEVMSFDLANLKDDPRLHMGPDSGKDSTTWIIIGLVVAGAVVWAVADGGGDDDDDDDSSN